MSQYLQTLVRDVEVHRVHKKLAWQLLRQVPILQILHMHLADLYRHRAHCGLTNHQGGGSLAHPKR